MGDWIDDALQAHGDALWRGRNEFHLSQPYAGSNRVIRGDERSHLGLVMTDVTATIDGGAGLGGPLIAACLDETGRLDDPIEI